MIEVYKSKYKRHKVIRTTLISLLIMSFMLNVVYADRTDVEGLYGNESEVHIKEETGDHLTFEDIKNTLLAKHEGTAYLLESIFANRVSLTNQLPTTDDAGASQASNAAQSSTSVGDDGLTYGESMEVDDGTLFAAGNKHSWGIMCYGTITSTTSNQYKYTYHPTQSFTDEYGFRKFKVDGHEYYCIAVAAYFGLNGKFDSKSEFIDAINSDPAVRAEYNNMAGHAVQVELEDGSVVPCVIGDVKKATDPNMADNLRGHWDEKVPNFICVIETVVDCACGGGHPTENNWRKNGINSTFSAGAKYHKGSPWTSNPVRIRMGPMLSVQE